MQVELTPAQSSFVDLGIQEGRFRDPEEAVQRALAQWERRERARIELLSSLDLAEQALDAGEGEAYTAESLDELVESVIQRKRTKTLDEILEGIPEGAEMENISWGRDRGAEVW